MERVNGIEPSSSAWEAEVIPLYDTRLLHHPTWAWARVNTRVEFDGRQRGNANLVRAAEGLPYGASHKLGGL